MTCLEISGSYDAFALGIEDGPESSEIAAHLRRGCENCVPAVRSSLVSSAKLAMLAKAVEPPARLKRRIVAAVTPEARESNAPRGFGWGLLWGAAAFTLLCVSGLLTWQLQRVGNLRLQEAARLDQILGVLSDPGSQEVAFNGTASKPRGKVVVNRKRGVVLLASYMPPLGPGKTFEMWLIPRVAGAKAIPGPLFHAAKDGTAVAIDSGEVWSDIGAVAVTVEKEGGVSAPTTTPIIVATGV